jgi:cobalt-zinc-cadmium efflux system outer membrane protein
VEKIPNLDILGGLRYNRELLEVGQRPVGLEGFFDVGVRIPLFDRNQGGVQAARAEVTSAERNVERVQLALRSRLAVAFREYLDAREAAMRYQTAMLPRAQRAYDLYLISFRQMAASYPQALIAQRTLFQLQDEYNDTLAIAWTKATEIRGLLLMGLDNMESVRPNKGR